MLANHPSNAARCRLDDVSRSLLDRVLGVYVSPFRSRLLFADDDCGKSSWPDVQQLVVSETETLECCVSVACRMFVLC